MNEEKDPFPVEVRIENTNLCNAKCIMCPRDKMIRKQEVMGFDLFKKIVNQCVKLDVKMVHVHGFGEPLIDKHIFRKIKYLKDHGIPETYMVTNGSLLDEEKSKQLIESGLDAMNISFYGMTKETYERIHAGLNFEKTYNNIINFFKIKKEMNKQKPKTHITFLVQKQGKHEKNLFIKTFRNIADDIRIAPIHNYGVGKNYIKFTKKNRISCGPMFFLHALQILCDGKVTSCCFDTNGELIFGDANEQSLLDIWRDGKFVQFRKDHMAKRFSKYSLCDNCDQLDPEVRIKRKFKFYRTKNRQVVEDRNAW